MKFKTEKEWKDFLKTLKKRNILSNRKRLKNSIIQAVKRRIPNKLFGIFFSGGVDSTLIAHLCNRFDATFICYCVGLEGADDVEAAQKAAKDLGFPLRYKVLTVDEVEKILKKIKKILPNKDIVSMGVGAVIYAAAQLARKDKVNVFFSGLGSEEIFAGYQRHAEAKDVQAECWRGLNNMWQRDVKRDLAIAKSMKFKFLLPFLDEDVIKNAMGIDPHKKIAKKFKKVILRQVAEELGIPHAHAWRKKKAAQYGSKFDKAIKKLAKKYKFKYKKDYLDFI